MVLVVPVCGRRSRSRRTIRFMIIFKASNDAQINIALLALVGSPRIFPVRSGAHPAA